MRHFFIAVMILVFARAGLADDALRIEGPEQSRLLNKLPDGGIPAVVGVQNFQVFRASRDMPQITDGKGWTYNHHVDICCWAGWLYVAWDNGQKDEDTWPAHEVFSTSSDGVSWSSPAELFPLGASNPLRMYFYHAKNGRMLAIAARRLTHAKMTDPTRGGVIVRELLADHSLGPVYTLIKSPAADGQYPFFDQSPDKTFAEACRQLLADDTFLEQQDYGVLLGDAKMKPYDGAPSDFGKAFCFFYRPAGSLIGICKKGYVVRSSDDGLSWTSLGKLTQFTAGTAKEWIQLTPDGRFAWAHDPFPTDRFPLVIMAGDDGVTFANPRVVHGEVPRQRYEGLDKNIGPQYVRGISYWNSDGSRNEDAIWLAYSVNKEDIWVSRVPVPIRIEGPAATTDHFADFPLGRIIAGWNTYVPKWADVSMIDSPDGRCLRLEDHDPYDYAGADRVFSPRAKANVEFEVMTKSAEGPDLEIELWSEYGDARPVRIALRANGKIDSSSTTLGQFQIGQWTKIAIDADATIGKFTIAINDGKPSTIDFAEKADSLDRIVFRTGEYRSLPIRGNEVLPGTDVPTKSSEYLVLKN